MILGLFAVALGMGSIQAASVGTIEDVPSVAAVHLAILGSLPAVIALNIGGWDRVYQATSAPLIYISIAMGLVTTGPTLLTFLARRRIDNSCD